MSAGIQVNNTAMNTLVYKYGEAAKESGSTIVDQVLFGTTNPPAADVKLVGALTIDGASCNDNNAATVGETWLNGVCQGGISTNGTLCNDGEVKTINDIYTDGVCAGTNVEGQSCTDDNFLTIQDKYVNGVCVGTLTANGQSCNDSNVMTVNDIYTDGVCAGTLTVNGASCDDGLVMTVNDVYNNGVCAGTLTVNGQSCSDGNIMTVNDIYTNGVCAGTLTVNGTTCNDNVSTTYGDKWLNGVCSGFTNGTSCNDGNSATLNDIYTNGVCAGTIPVAITFSDNNNLGLTTTQINLLSSYLGVSIGTQFNLLYDTAINTRTSDEFHIKVDGNSHIVVLIKLTNGDIIGGYTGSVFFNSRWDWVGYTSGVSPKIFNLTRSIVSNSITDPSRVLLDYPNYGPTFGEGLDLYINQAMTECQTNNVTYTTNTGTNITGGSTSNLVARVITYDIVGR